MRTNTLEYSEFKALFLHALQLNSLPTLEEVTVQSFYRFNTHLLEVNKTTNLTAIRNTEDVIVKHDIDSLLASDLIPTGAKVLDLGCGPGFPSIPLAIARPDLTITALDSTAKKIAFVNQTAELLELNNLKGVSGRAEDRVLAKQLGKFDVVISRAVARLNILAELCLPYVQIGGSLIAMKAAKAEEEVAEATRAIQILGGSPANIRKKSLVTFDATKEARCLVEVQKAKETPPVYPRAYATILKKPL